MLSIASPSPENERQLSTGLGLITQANNGPLALKFCTEVQSQQKNTYTCIGEYGTYGNIRAIKGNMPK